MTQLDTGDSEGFKIRGPLTTQGGVTNELPVVNSSTMSVAGLLSALGGLDVAKSQSTPIVNIHGGGDYRQVLIGKTKTTADQRFGIGTQHRTITEEAVALLIGLNSTTGNRIWIGGGTAAYNAATEIKLYTGAAITTTTGTSRLEINSVGTVDLKAAVVYSGIETIAAGGTTTALSLVKELHSIDADAGGDIFTLADGAIGQVMTITCLSATGVCTITPANMAGGTSVTLNAAGESVMLRFVDTNWYIVGGNAFTVI